MRFKKIVRLFEEGNVSVSGLRGRGKDMLMANVAVRRKKPYVSNVDYGGKYLPLDLSKLDISGNKYTNFISGKVVPYHYPYEDGVDFYISDAGIYFPSQFCNELNRQFPNLSTFMALSRHLGDCNVHYNSQNLNRVWDKIREQSDTYICCRGCIVIFGFVLQRVRIYEVFNSAVTQTPPFPVKKPWFNRDRRLSWELSHANYVCSHGEIRKAFLFYRNKSKYDTRIFKKILEGGAPGA